MTPIDSALKSNSDEEIARLAEALRQAEAERDTLRAKLREMTFNRDVAITLVNTTIDERNTWQTEAIDLRLKLMNAEACRAQAELNLARNEEAIPHRFVAIQQRDDARADAERLAYAIMKFLHSCRSGNTGLSEYDCIIREMEESVAAHAQAVMK